MRKKWKRSFVTALSMALAVGNCVPAMAAPAGWRESTAGWQYVNADGSVQKGWFQDTKGDWYFLDYNTGIMKTGWVQPNDGKWYFLDYHTGAMKTGWIKPMDGKWYYLNPVSNGTKGAMQTGWVQTPDKKWYYMDASGAMQTGTITVNNQVWTLDANGAWDGKAATSVTYVSSSSRRPSGGGGGTTTDKNKVTGTGWEGNKETGEVTVTGTEVDGESIKAKLGKDITDLTIDTPEEKGAVTVKNAKVTGELTITDKVGNGNVLLDNVEVVGNTYISGGGSSTVRLKDCILRNVFASKKLDKEGAKPLHIKFEGTTKFAEGSKVEANEGNLLIDVESGITIPSVVANISIVLRGAGTVGTFRIAKPISVVLAIQVEVLTIDKTATTADATAEIDVQEGTTAPAPQGEGADNIVLKGDGKVEQYYDVILDANGGFWLVENIETKEKVEETKKKIKVENGKGIGSVIDTNFEQPENNTVGSTAFLGWYTDKDTISEETKIDSDSPEAYKDMTLYAGWGATKVGVTEATISGTPKVGETLTASANADATGTIKYQWQRGESADGEFTDIPDAASKTYKVDEADAGKYIRVVISGDNDSSKTSEAVQIESVEQAVDLEITAATATVSGASVKATTASGTAVKIELTTTSGSAVTLKTLEFTANGEIATTDFKEQEVENGTSFVVVCTPSDTNKYKETKVTVEIIITTEN